VYRNESSDDLLSELRGDNKPLWYYGTTFEFSPKRQSHQLSFFAAVGLKFGIPGKSGIMEDRDGNGITGVLTHYSEHASSVQNAALFDLPCGIDIPAFFLSFRIS
jgi:hypothetical protein